MAYLRAVGCCLPARVVENAEIAELVGADPAWLVSATGIQRRRFAAPEETVATLAAKAARDCLENAGIAASDVGFLIVASGSGEKRFPGPASAAGALLGIPGTPVLDVPMASAGSLFGLALAAQLCAVYRNVLVVGSEIMSRAVRLDAAGRDTAVLFGDGAGAILVSAQSGFARIADSLLASDGELAEILRLDFDSPIHMDGRSVILQAARKVPRAILELLQRNGLKAGDVGTFLMHQANLNLITRVAQAVGAPETSFFRNLSEYGNTSSASMLIAAAEFFGKQPGPIEKPVVFAAFGAGIHWGAVLAV